MGSDTRAMPSQRSLCPPLARHQFLVERIAQGFADDRHERIINGAREFPLPAQPYRFDRIFRPAAQLAVKRLLARAPLTSSFTQRCFRRSCSA